MKFYIFPQIVLFVTINLGSQFDAHFPYIARNWLKHTCSQLHSVASFKEAPI